MSADTIYADALALVPTLRPTAPDDDCPGYVGEVDRTDIMPLQIALADAASV